MAAFIPAINDFLNFPAYSLKDKGYGTFIGLVTAITFSLYPFVRHVDPAFGVCP